MILNYLVQALPWDIAIFLLIAGGGACVFLAFKRQKWSNRLRISIGVIGLVVSLIVIYGSFVEPRIITITEEDITFPTIDDMKIVMLGDLHVGPYKDEKFLNKVVSRVNDLEPDLVLLVGDYVSLAGDPLDRLNPLGDLSSKYGVFGVLGNHEYGCMFGKVRTRTHGIFDSSKKVQRALERVGVRVLSNEWLEIEVVGDGNLFIGGIDDACSSHDQIADALPVTTKKSSVILLAHDPSVILDNRASYANLIASGHTHGGQIRLPWIGPILPLPTQISRSFDQGIFQLDGNTTLAITRGLGEAGPRARLFAWPEIMLLRVNPST